jgi:UDPglucose 6-dehydrogenase
MALTHGMHPQLLNAVMEINDFQRKHVILKVRDLLGGSLEGKQIGLLGLAFKPNTDDVRDAPSLTIARSIVNQGGKVRAYDPVAMETASSEFSAMGLCETPYEVAEGADAVIVITEWNEFKQLDMTRLRDLMKTPNLVDARNLYDPSDMQAIGFVYRGMGRGYNGVGVKEE